MRSTELQVLAERLADAELAPEIKVAQGRVQGARVLVVLEGEVSAFDRLWLAVFLLGGEPMLLHLQKEPDSDSYQAQIHLGLIIEKMLVYGLRGEVLQRLAHEPQTYRLDRVLCRNMDEINKNIRWNGRIDCYSTRVYAALNSFQHLEAQAELASYCLVSIGYTALERADDPTSLRVFRALRALFKGHLHELQGDPRFSLLTHLMHHALHLKRPLLFERLAQLNLDSLDQLTSSPSGASNAMVMLLLSGIYYFELGMRERALEIFAKADPTFRLAVQLFPRDLAKFRELTVLCDRAYLAQVGLAASRGGRALRPELGITMFDTLYVAGEVSRLLGPEPKKRVGGWMRELVKARKAELQRLSVAQRGGGEGLGLS